MYKLIYKNIQEGSSVNRISQASKGVGSSVNRISQAPKVKFVDRIMGSIKTGANRTLEAMGVGKFMIKKNSGNKLQSGDIRLLRQKKK